MKRPNYRLGENMTWTKIAGQMPPVNEWVLFVDTNKTCVEICIIRRPNRRKTLRHSNKTINY